MKKLSISIAVLSASLWAQTGNVRIIHASPDAPPVDVLVDGKLVIQALPYLQSTAYLPVPVGSHLVQVNVSGTATTVLQATPSISSGASYTAIAAGFAASTPALGLLWLTDDNSPPAFGNIKLRVIHAAPSAPGVDVYLTTPYAALANTTPALSNVPFGVVSPYVSVQPSLYQARVAVAGTENVAIDSGAVDTYGWIAKTILAVDAPGGGAPFAFLIVTDQHPLAIPLVN